jgi:hypothetical protein
MAKPLCVALVLTLLTACSGHSPRLLSVSGWTLTYNSPILMRNSVDSGLLLRQEGSTVVLWKSDPKGGRLTVASDALWNSSPHTVVPCAGRIGPPELEIWKGQATWRGTTLTLSGRRAYASALSSDGRTVAILSSSGQPESLFHFLGVGELSPYYVQFMDVATGRFLSTGLKLPFGRETGGLIGCWSPNDRHFVLMTLYVDNLVVVTPTTVEPTR